MCVGVARSPPPAGPPRYPPPPGGWGGGGGALAPLPTRAEWLSMGPGEWRRRFGATALNRAGRRGVQRNAAISAGAAGDRSALPSLARPTRTRDRGLADAAGWAVARLDHALERTP
jgi:hypothetical protein